MMWVFFPFFLCCLAKQRFYSKFRVFFFIFQHISYFRDPLFPPKKKFIKWFFLFFVSPRRKWPINKTLRACLIPYFIVKSRTHSRYNSNDDIPEKILSGDLRGGKTLLCQCHTLRLDRSTKPITLCIFSLSDQNFK